VTIHRRNCTNILNEDEKERLVKVEWGEAGVSFPVHITVDAWDRVGLLRDVSALVSGEDVNITSVSLSDPESRDGTLSILLTIDIKNIGQLGRLFGKLEAVPGVINVSRSSDVRREG
jgi:guanosine-3',5'-bis(diphosphate) 3'-pyrophosphohydrolase